MTKGKNMENEKIVMNPDIEKIMVTFRISRQLATEVLNDMETDFSECSDRQFLRDAKNALIAILVLRNRKEIK